MFILALCHRKEFATEHFDDFAYKLSDQAIITVDRRKQEI